MTDAEWIFKTDCADKKRIARSASKKNRTGKGPIRFPSDNLTKKELRKMNGDIKTYKINDCISWKEFLIYPHDIQQEYLDSIAVKYHPNAHDLTEMFGANSVKTLYAYFSRHKLNAHLRQNMSSCSLSNEWKKFCGLDIPVSETISPEPLTPVIEKCCIDEKLVAVKQENPIVCPYLESGTFTVTGDAYMVMDILEIVCGKSKYKFTIKFEEVNNENE